MSRFFLIFYLLILVRESKSEKFGKRVKQKGMIMKEELRHGSLDAEFSISEERARELLARIAARDVDGPFDELVAAFGRPMRRILAARVKDKTELEDVEQDFWLKVVQNAGKYGGKAPVKRVGCR